MVPFIFPFPIPDPSLVLDTVIRYSTYINDNYKFVEDTVIPDFSSPYIDTDELLMPFTEFLDKTEFNEIRTPLEYIVSLGGGDSKKTITYFALQLASPRVLPFIIAGIQPEDIGLPGPLYHVPIAGCSLVYKKMKEFILGSGGAIYLNTKVRGIKRLHEMDSDGGNNIITFKNENALDSVRYRNTTIAYPQIRKDLIKMLKLTRQENDVFKKTSFYSSYYTGVWRASGYIQVPVSIPRTHSLGWFVFNRQVVDGNVVLPPFPYQAQCLTDGFDSNGNSYVVPQVCFNGPSCKPTKSTARDTRRTLKFLEGPVFDILSGNTIEFEEKPIEFYEHKFGLRVEKAEDSRCGIYEKLLNLQGQKGGVFYTGALFSQLNQLAVWRAIQRFSLGYDFE